MWLAVGPKRDVEGGREGSVGVIFIVKKERWVESRDQGFVGRGRSQTFSQEDRQTGTNQRVVEQYKTWQTFVWSKRQEHPMIRK